MAGKALAAKDNSGADMRQNRLSTWNPAERRFAAKDAGNPSNEWGDSGGLYTGEGMTMAGGMPGWNNPLAGRPMGGQADGWGVGMPDTPLEETGVGPTAVARGWNIYGLPDPPPGRVANWNQYRGMGGPAGPRAPGRAPMRGPSMPGPMGPQGPAGPTVGSDPEGYGGFSNTGYGTTNYGVNPNMAGNFGAGFGQAGNDWGGGGFSGGGYGDYGYGGEGPGGQGQQHG